MDWFWYPFWVILIASFGMATGYLIAELRYKRRGDRYGRFIGK